MANDSYFRILIGSRANRENKERFAKTYRSSIATCNRRLDYRSTLSIFLSLAFRMALFVFLYFAGSPFILFCASVFQFVCQYIYSFLLSPSCVFFSTSVYSCLGVSPFVSLGILMSACVALYAKVKANAGPAACMLILLIQVFAFWPSGSYSDLE